MRKEIKIGLTVLVAIALFYTSIAWVKRIHIFAPEETSYIIHFDQVNGLLEGDPVKVRGYQAGRVNSILPDADKVKVIIKIDQKVQLYQNALAEIRIKELLGGKMIEILPGNQIPVIKDGEIIKGKTAPDFTTAFSQFGDISQNLDLEKIFVFFDRMDSVVQRLDQFAARIDGSLTNQAIADLSGTLRETNLIMRELRTSNLIEEVDTSLNQVQNFMTRTDRILSLVEGVSRSAESDLLPKVDTLTTQLNSSLKKLDQTMVQANQLLAQVNGNQTIAGRVFNDPLLSRQIDTTLINLNKTLEQIHSKRVIIGIARKKEKK